MLFSSLQLDGLGPFVPRSDNFSLLEGCLRFLHDPGSVWGFSAIMELIEDLEALVNPPFGWCRSTEYEIYPPDLVAELTLG